MFGSSNVKILYRECKKVKLTKREMFDIIDQKNHLVYRRLLKVFCYKTIGKIQENGLVKAYDEMFHFLVHNKKYNNITGTKLRIAHLSLLIELKYSTGLSVDTKIGMYYNIKNAIKENPKLIHDIFEANNHLCIKLTKKNILIKYPIFNEQFIKDAIEINPNVLIHLDNNYIDEFGLKSDLLTHLNNDNIDGTIGENKKFCVVM